MTPELWPVWWKPIWSSRSSTTSVRARPRRSSSRATARPRIPAPTTATSALDLDCAPMSTAPVRTMPLPARVLQALRHSDHFWQVARYAAVGAAGYVVSVSVFAVAVHLGAGYILAATIAFVCALVHNFAWNRHWTFKAGDGHAGFQWLKWVAINVGA